MELITMTHEELLHLPLSKRKEVLKLRAEWLERQRKQDKKEAELQYEKIKRFLNRSKRSAYMKIWRAKNKDKIKKYKAKEEKIRN